MSYNLFLDDIRTPHKASLFCEAANVPLYNNELWTVVKNYMEFVREIESRGLPDLVSFDHDLAEVHYNPDIRRESFVYYPETGLDCMKWMINYIIDNNLKPPKVLVHSMNPSGAENIKILFNNFLKHYKWDNSKESAILTGK